MFRPWIFGARCRCSAETRMCRGQSRSAVHEVSASAERASAVRARAGKSLAAEGRSRVLVSFLADMAAALVAFAGLTYWNESSAVPLPRKTRHEPSVSIRKEVVYPDRDRELPYRRVMTTCLRVQKPTGDVRGLRRHAFAARAAEARSFACWAMFVTRSAGRPGDRCAWRGARGRSKPGMRRPSKEA